MRPSGRRGTPVSPGAPRSPGLQVLDPAQHVQVSGGVLLDHVLHVVRPQGLLELLLVQEELHDPKTEEKQVWFLVQAKSAATGHNSSVHHWVSAHLS